ncbi:hypothetical protein [Polyangium sorediatum]|uniref:Uncharacterized protein n=1 Tax=Polyangium sorediatum TaxID=889274 RepID=A0ABT6P4M5_9BACT|nr:hypothetical protein [Polyangium sorediatum]MDI1435287.1 hypothetical protein [Polyangium sorediatum]
MQIRSFKLRVADHHVRVVPMTDAAGCPFAGPGVDLRGERAAQAFAAAGPLFEALASFEPGVVLRALSFDFERERLLATLSPTAPDADPRPRVVRIDGGPALQILLPLAAVLATTLAALAAPVLAERPKDPVEA